MIGSYVFWTFASSESICTTPMTVCVSVGLGIACERGTNHRTLRISAQRKRVPLKPPRCDSKSDQEPGLATHTCHLSSWQEDYPKCEVSLRNRVSSRPVWACVRSYLPKKDAWGNGSVDKVLAVQAQGLGFGSSVLM